MIMRAPNPFRKKNPNVSYLYTYFFRDSFIHPHHRKSPGGLKSEEERSVYVIPHLNTVSLCKQAGYNVYKYTKR